MRRVTLLVAFVALLAASSLGAQTYMACKGCDEVNGVIRCSKLDQTGLGCLAYGDFCTTIGLGNCPLYQPYDHCEFQVFYNSAGPQYWLSGWTCDSTPEIIGSTSCWRCPAPCSNYFYCDEPPMQICPCG